MYVPINAQIFNAAYSGTLAGMIASGRVITDPNSADYTQQTAIVGVFAIAFDQAWNNAAAPSLLEVYATMHLCASTWTNYGPTVAEPAFFTTQAKALVAALLSAKDFFASQSIIPPVTPSGTLAGDTTGPTSANTTVGLHGIIAHQTATLSDGSTLAGGAASALPATPETYVEWTINGTTLFIPAYHTGA